MDLNKPIFFQSHSKAVSYAFVRLFDSGLIYRGNFLVNWSTRLQSAISDIEVDHIEVSKKTKLSIPGIDKPVDVGLIYDVAYKIFDEHSSSGNLSKYLNYFSKLMSERDLDFQRLFEKKFPSSLHLLLTFTNKFQS